MSVSVGTSLTSIAEKALRALADNLSPPMTGGRCAFRVRAGPPSPMR